VQIQLNKHPCIHQYRFIFHSRPLHPIVLTEPPDYHAAHDQTHYEHTDKGADDNTLSALFVFPGKPRFSARSE
jgi:hypothetical protein